MFPLLTKYSLFEIIERSRLFHVADSLCMNAVCPQQLVALSIRSSIANWRLVQNGLEIGNLVSSTVLFIPGLLGHLFPQKISFSLEKPCFLIYITNPSSRLFLCQRMAVRWKQLTCILGTNKTVPHEESAGKEDEYVIFAK